MSAYEATVSDSSIGTRATGPDRQGLRLMSGAKNAQLTEDVYSALVCTLFSTLLPTLIMATSFLLVGVWIVAETRDMALLGLLVLAGIAAIARIVVVMLYRREAGDSALTAVRAGQLERRFAIPYLSFALLFGLFAARAFAIGSAEHLPVLVGLLFGYGAGVAAGISLRPWISIPSALIAILPTILTSLFLPGPGYWGVGLLTALFLAGGIESILRRYQATSHQFTTQNLLSSADRQDALTGLPNELSLRERFTRISGPTMGAEMVAIHRVMIDRLDAINDSLGYAAGDIVLKAVSERLLRLTGAGEFPVRLGGAEFAIVQPGILQPRAVETLAQNIVAAITRPYVVSGRDLTIGAHVGYASELQQGADIDRLLSRAHAAALQAAREAREVHGHSEHRWTSAGTARGRAR